MHYQWDFVFLLRYAPLFWKGVLVTLAYTAGTISLGLILGLLIGLGRLSKSWVLNLPLIAFIEAFRCTPLLVQIVWFYYALPVLLGLQIPATAAAVMTLSCYTGAFTPRFSVAVSYRSSRDSGTPPAPWASAGGT